MVLKQDKNNIFQQIIFANVKYYCMVETKDTAM